MKRITCDCAEILDEVSSGWDYESGYHLYIYDIMEERMKQLKEQGTYLIERVECEQ